MKKFAVAQIKGGNKKILGLFDDKKLAQDFGKAQRIPRADGMVYVYASDFNEAGEQTSNSETFYGVCN